MKSYGFTLVEILVALAIFVIIGGVALNLLISAIDIQRTTFADQVIVAQLSFVAEYMSRTIRQAEKDVGDACLTSGTNLNYEVRDGGKTLRFLDQDMICKEFSFQVSSKAILERNSINATASFGAWVSLTSNDIEVQDVSFFIQGEDQADSIQPRATFFIDAGDFQLQTTISQRRFDVVE